MHLFKKITLTVQMLAMHFFAKAQYDDFSKIPHNNKLQAPPDSLVHQLAQVFFKKATAPGLIVGISQGDRQFYYGYGHADQATLQPFTATTVFEAGSITKTFLAHLLFRLEAEGKLRSSDLITKYLPDSVAQNPALKGIRLMDLANHTSGLPRLPDNMEKVPGYEMMQPYKNYSAGYLYAFLKTAALNKPGKYDYSNLGWGLLGTILASISQQSLETLLQQYLFAPLQMNDSWMQNTKREQKMATGYFNKKPAAFWQFDALAGAGAIKTTATDMLRYLEAHWGVTGNKAYDEVVKTITKPSATVAANLHIGYGWHILNDAGRALYWHNGGTYGFSTFVAFEPQSRTALVLAANGFNNNSFADKMAIELMKSLVK
jgi:CubicO group peptidase (beta-lactamase class C family)